MPRPVCVDLPCVDRGKNIGKFWCNLPWFNACLVFAWYTIYPRKNTRRDGILAVQNIKYGVQEIASPYSRKPKEGRITVSSMFVVDKIPLRCKKQSRRCDNYVRCKGIAAASLSKPRRKGVAVASNMKKMLLLNPIKSVHVSTAIKTDVIVMMHFSRGPICRNVTILWGGGGSMKRRCLVQEHRKY
jgi:hypothetical protein